MSPNETPGRRGRVAKPIQTVLMLGGLAAGVLFAALLGLRTYASLTTSWPEAPVENAAATEAEAEALAKASPGFLYGRVTTDDGSTHEGRLRWGGDQEAFWNDYFNGVKIKNPWAADVPPPTRTRPPVRIFGFEFAPWAHEVDLDRPFLARLGDIVRIEALGLDVRVTLKSGSVYDLDYLKATDFADGIRVWNADGTVVDLAPRRIRIIEFLPASRLDAAPARLHGTVKTRQGDFTGFLQWNRRGSVGSDRLDGRGPDGDFTARFDTIRSIARDSPDSSAVTLLDGREVVLSGSREVGRGNRGIYVEDARYGRVLVTWDTFRRVDFSPDGSGPGYDDFPPGRALSGIVTTWAGRRLAGRLVYDLDERETTDTLDASSAGLNYNVPFGLVTSIELPGRSEGSTGRARVTLRGGEELKLELTGDLGKDNGGVLVFAGEGQAPEYVSWGDVRRIEFTNF